MKSQQNPEQQEERQKVVEKAKEGKKKKSPLGNGAHEDQMLLHNLALEVAAPDCPCFPQCDMETYCATGSVCFGNRLSLQREVKMHPSGVFM